MAKLPMQPIEFDSLGEPRFRKNAIVRWLVDRLSDIEGSPLGRIAMEPFSQEDREQFYQLIGYSVSGYGDIEEVSRESVAAADELLQRAKTGTR